MLSFSNSSKNTPTVSSSLSIHDLLLIPKAMTQSTKSYNFLNIQAAICYLILTSHKHRNCFTSLKWRKPHTVKQKKRSQSTWRKIACKAEKAEDSNMTKSRMIGRYHQKCQKRSTLKWGFCNLHDDGCVTISDKVTFLPL